MAKTDGKSSSTNISGLFIRDFNAVREIMRSIYLFGCYDKNDYINTEGIIKFKTGTSEGNISRSKVEIEISRFQFLLGESFFNANDTAYHCDYSVHDKKDDTMLAMYRNHTFTRLNLQSYILLLQALDEIDDNGDYKHLRITDIFESLNNEHRISVSEAGSDDMVARHDNVPCCYDISKSKLQSELDELKELGYIEEEAADKKTYMYNLKPDFLMNFSDEEIIKLCQFLDFCSRSIAIQAPYYFASRKLKMYLKYERGYKEEINNDFLFRHNFIYNSLDNEIAMMLLKGIKGRQIVEIEIYYRDVLSKSYESTMRKMRIIPVKIVHDLWTGKQDLLCYNLETKKAETHRLDLIYLVYPKEDVSAKLWDIASKECEAIHHTWRTFLRSPYGPETVRIKFNIPKDDEKTLHRLEFEGVIDHGGKLEKKGKDLIFEVHTLDADDMLTWICSFGECATVLEPEHLAQRVNEVWKTSLDLIEGKTPIEGGIAKYNTVEVKSKGFLSGVSFVKHNNFMYEAMTRLINDKVEEGDNFVKESELIKATSEALGRDIHNSLISFDNKEHKFYDLFAPAGNNTKKDEHEKTYFIRIFKHIPIVFNNSEKEAIVNAAYLPQSGYFLDEELINKVKALIDQHDLSWSIYDVLLKNKRDYGDERNKEFLENIQIFRQAINENVAITCDLELDKKKLKKVKLYPLVMDYFATTDKVDAIAYYEDKDEIRHIDFNTVSNIKITKDKKELDEKYQNWRKEEYKTTTFEIVPKMFAIDRIVRMFSNYKRQVEYNPENETYKMSIEYSKNDYAILQRDILSAGEYIVVLEPLELKELIHDRVKKANGNYK